MKKDWKIEEDEDLGIIKSARAGFVELKEYDTNFSVGIYTPDGDQISTTVSESELSQLKSLIEEVLGEEKCETCNLPKGMPSEALGEELKPTKHKCHSYCAEDHCGECGCFKQEVTDVCKGECICHQPSKETVVVHNHYMMEGCNESCKDLKSKPLHASQLHIEGEELRFHCKDCLSLGADVIYKCECKCHKGPVELQSFRYNELIHAVESKYPGETRHETALRYIKQAESGEDGVLCTVQKELCNAFNLKCYHCYSSECVGHECLKYKEPIENKPVQKPLKEYKITVEEL